MPEASVASSLIPAVKAPIHEFPESKALRQGTLSILEPLSPDKEDAMTFQSLRQVLVHCLRVRTRQPGTQKIPLGILPNVFSSRDSLYLRTFILGQSILDQIDLGNHQAPLLAWRSSQT